MNASTPTPIAIANMGSNSGERLGRERTSLSIVRLHPFQVRHAHTQRVQRVVAEQDVIAAVARKPARLAGAMIVLAVVAVRLALRMAAHSARARIAAVDRHRKKLV